MPIDLRKAEIAKLYKKAQFSAPKAGITSIKSNIEYVDLTEIKLKGLNVIYGINGSGKTLFLKTLEGHDSCFNFFNTNVSLNDSPDFIYYSPSDSVVKSKETVQKISQSLLQETLEQYSPIVLADDEVRQVNYVIGASYTSINIFEIENDDEEYIFISVTEGEVKREHSGLSDGEIYIIHLFWFLKYKLEHRHLLIDEPESYLYPKAQIRMIELIIMLVDVSIQQVFIASHSKDIVSALQRCSLLKLIKQSDEEFIFNEGNPNDQLLGEMGLKTNQPKLVLVEDAKAKAFLSFLIDQYVTQDTHHLLIVSSANGEGDLSSVFNRISELEREHILLCYDADASDKDLIPKDLLDNAISLPGTLAPEQELLVVIESCSKEFIKSFEEEFRVPIIEGLAQLKGQDHHDYFEELSKVSRVNMWEIFKNACHIWLALPENSTNSEHFISEFVEYI